MGCDIHVKSFVYSNVEKKMVPLNGAFPDSDYFPVILGSRDYDLFGLFGNSFRSHYPELECLHDGYPKFMEEMTVYKMADCVDYHTRRWCNADELKNELLEYKDRLLDPKKWNDHYKDDSDFVLDAIEGKISLETYQKSHEYLIASIDTLVTEIDRVKSWVDDYSNLLDESKIVFVTWMDN